jgi:hypothetical protein
VPVPVARRDESVSMRTLTKQRTERLFETSGYALKRRVERRLATRVEI